MLSAPLRLFLIVIIFIAGGAFSGPIIIYEVKNPYSIDTIVKNSDISVTYQTSIEDPKCDVGLEWSYKRDGLLPSGIWAGRVKKFKGYLVCALIRADRIANTATLNVDFHDGNSSLATKFDCRKGLGPVQLHSQFFVEEQKIDFALVHDFLQRTGSILFSTIFQPNINVDLSLKESGNSSLNVSHQRKIKADTIFSCNVNVLPLMSYGFNAFGEDFIQLSLSKRIGRYSNMSVSVLDTGDMKWSFKSIVSGSIAKVSLNVCKNGERHTSLTIKRILQ